jgi:hypothetical protein
LHPRHTKANSDPRKPPKQMSVSASHMSLVKS